MANFAVVANAVTPHVNAQRRRQGKFAALATIAAMAYATLLHVLNAKQMVIAPVPKSHIAALVDAFNAKKIVIALGKVKSASLVNVVFQVIVH